MCTIFAYTILISSISKFLAYHQAAQLLMYTFKHKIAEYYYLIEKTGF